MLGPSQAIQLLQDAPFADDGLLGALPRVAALLNADYLHYIHIAPGRPPVFLMPACMAAVHADYSANDWFPRDDWTKSSHPVAGYGVLLTDDALIAPEVRARSAFFQEFGRTWGTEHFAAWKFDIDGQEWGCTFSRAAKRGEFSIEEKQALRAVRQAGSSAALLAAALRETKLCGVLEGLAQAGRAALTLDHNGQVRAANALCEPLFDTAFRPVAGRLTASDPQTDRALARLAGEARAAPGAMRAPAPVKIAQQDRAPTLLLPVRLGTAGLDLLPGSRLLVVLIDASAPPQSPNTRWLRDAFNLTERESQVAAALATGASITAIAAGAGLTPAHVRQVVKAVMAKTNTHRQAELVSLLATFLGLKALEP